MINTCITHGLRFDDIEGACAECEQEYGHKLNELRREMNYGLYTCQMCGKWYMVNDPNTWAQCYPSVCRVCLAGAAERKESGKP